MKTKNAQNKAGEFAGVTNRSYFELNGIRFADALRMWDKEQYRTFDNFLNAPYVWRATYNVGDIVINEDSVLAVLVVIKVNEKNHTYTTLDLSSAVDFCSDHSTKLKRIDCPCNWEEAEITNHSRLIGRIEPNVLKEISRECP